MVRPLNLNDKMAISAHLLSFVDQNEEPYFTVPQSLDNEVKQGGVWGLFENSELIALVAGHWLAGDYEITWLSTLPEHTNKGHMGRLLSFIFEHYLKGKKLMLEVHERNIMALKLYIRLGFQKDGIRPRYYKDGGAAILMSKSLP